MRRLRRGEWLAAVGGVALLALMWAPWYGDANAWEAFAVVDVVLALAALSGIAAAFLQATRRSPAMPIAADVLGSVVCLLALLLLVIRTLDPPGSADRAWGVFAGLAACAVLTAGVCLAMHDE